MIILKLLRRKRIRTSKRLLTKTKKNKKIKPLNKRLMKVSKIKQWLNMKRWFGRIMQSTTRMTNLFTI